jgi:3'(2'), 5'-bisphosphate nucleotidase
LIIHSDTYQKALIAAIAASKVIMEIYTKGFQSKFKTDGSPVTEADIAAASIIGEHLQETGIPVVGEESEVASYEIRKNWDFNWCVDPLDGTKEYIKRNGEFAVNIALIHQNQAVFGVIAWPVAQKILFGGSAVGVHIADFDSVHSPTEWQVLAEKKEANSPLVVASSRTPHCGASASYLQQLTVNHGAIDFLKKGSALKFFDLALGAADIYPRFAPTMEWDIAAGQAILEALGGAVCSVETGLPLSYNKENLLNPHFVAVTKPLVLDTYV